MLQVTHHANHTIDGSHTSQIILVAHTIYTSHVSHTSHVTMVNNIVCASLGCGGRVEDENSGCSNNTRSINMPDIIIFIGFDDTLCNTGICHLMLSPLLLMKHLYYYSCHYLQSMYLLFLIQPCFLP